MQDILFLMKKYLKEWIFAILICVCLALSCFSIFKNNKAEETPELMANISEENPEPVVEEQSTTYHVDIKGAVNNPGVYEVDSESIVSDVITLAGGFKEDAYQDGINLSKKVSDEMVIYVYTTNEMKETNGKETSSTKTCDSADYNIKDCVEKSESIIVPGNTSENVSDEENTPSIININTATKSELTKLTGIGDAKAEAIIEYRNTNGYFKSIEDLLKVKGIGDAIFAKIKDNITV